VAGNIGAFSFVWREEKSILDALVVVVMEVSVTFGMAEDTSQLGANDVTAGQNLRSFIACGKSGSFISFICCGIFMFFTAETARAGAAAIPACTHHTDGRSVENGQFPRKIRIL
jgi:hypothetical protein